MLLWHDSFGSYTTQAQLDRNYPLNFGSGALFRQQGRFPSSRCMGSGSVWYGVTKDLQTFGAPGTDVCLVGFAALMRPQATGGIVVSTQTAGSLHRQVEVIYRARGSRFYFDVVRVSPTGVFEEVLLSTATYSHGDWNYFELRVVFSQSGGVVEWRANGFTEGRVQNVRTESDPNISRGWARVGFGVVNLNSTPTLLADVYVLNEVNGSTAPKWARFLGDVSGVPLFPDALKPGGADNSWVINPRPQSTGSKMHLCILSGQSNMEGMADLPLPPGIRNVNPYIQVWDRITQAPGPNSLVAGYNNNGAFLSNFGGPRAIAGAEMSFAEALATYYQQLPSTTAPTGLILLKDAQSASSLYPNIPDICWDPGTPGNLYNDYTGIAGPARGNLKNDITQLVAYYGGWNNFDTVDFFWYQGEAESSYTFAVVEYAARLQAFFDLIQSDFPLAKFRLFIFQIHRDVAPAYFPQREVIRAYQRQFVLNNKNAYLLSVDHLPIGPDGIHFAAPGYAAIGSRVMFEAWLKVQNYTKEIADYATGEHDGDLSWLGIEQAGKDTLHGLSSAGFTRGCHVHATRLEMMGRAVGGSSAPVRPIVSNGKQVAESPADLTLAGSYVSQSQSLLTNPVTGRPFREEDLRDHEFGFRSK